MKLFQGFIKSYEICSDIDNCLERLTHEDNLAVAASRAHFRTRLQQYKLFCFEPSQNIYDYSATFLIRHDFAWKRDIMDTFNKLISSGLISKWEKDLRVSRKSIVTSDVSTIRLTEFVTTFFLAAPAIALSVAMLFLEILAHRKSNSKNASHYWTLMDKIVCGRRCFFLLERNQNDDVITPFTV